MTTSPPRTSKAEDLADEAAHIPSSVSWSTSAFLEPLWQISLQFTPVELELLRLPPLRRLHRISHAGASGLTTLQTYSRLQHTLGVHALMCTLAPDDELARIAALLHDVGHLPFSHSLEGVAHLDHHALGKQLVLSDPIHACLARHGIDGHDVQDVIDGAVPSSMTTRPGLLNLDHLDSFVRSGSANGWLPVPAPTVLKNLRLVDGAIDTDRETGALLADLIYAEALLHLSADNLVPTALLREAVGALLDSRGVTRDALASMADAELLTTLLASPAARATVTRLLDEPHRLQLAWPEPGQPATYRRRKVYVSEPLVDGLPLRQVLPEHSFRLAALREAPVEYDVLLR